MEKEKLKSILMKYAEYVEERVEKAKSGEESIKPETLMDEVRTVNVLCVTYERMQHRAQSAVEND